MSVQPIPAGYHAVTPYLILRGASKAIEFYKQAFGATELMRLEAPGDKVGHAEIRIGDSPIMLGDEMPEMGFKGPEALGGSPISLMVYVADSDAVFNQAIAAGATVERPMRDEFYGDRTGSVRDPFGHIWHISTHKEDLSQEEIGRRAKELYD